MRIWNWSKQTIVVMNGFLFFLSMANLAHGHLSIYVFIFTFFSIFYAMARVAWIWTHWNEVDDYGRMPDSPDYKKKP